MKVATWNMAKRSRGLERLDDYLETMEVDIALLQETPPSDAYRKTFMATWEPDLLPDCRILARPDLHLRRVEPTPLRVFGSYATSASVLLGDEKVTLVSFHALAREARESELEGLRADEVRRVGVSVPWLNDVAFAWLEQFLRGRRFIVGCDINTSRLLSGGPEYMERALERGWVDLAYRHFSDQVPTFLTKRSSAHQLDYLFADEETAESCVDVMVDRSRTDLAGDGSSDHAPVIATFRF